MKCQRCGRELNDGVKFCESCGASIVQTSERNASDIPQTQSKKISIKPWQVVLLSVGGFFALVGIFFTFLLVIAFVFGTSEADTSVPVNANSVIESTVAGIDVTEEVTTVEPTTEDPTTVEPTTEKPTEDPETVEKKFKESCDTIDFETLSRNPEKYKGNKYKFTGEVIQVQEGWFNSVDLRINITKEEFEYIDDVMWTDTIYATVTIPDGEDNILVDDILTFWGVCDGEYTYETVLGNSISLPKISIEYYEINE